MPTDKKNSVTENSQEREPSLEVVPELLPGAEVADLHVSRTRVHRIVEVSPLIHPHLQNK